MTNITMKKYYNLFQPKFGVPELNEIKKVLASGILTQGKEVAKFEKMFANYVGSKYAVATNSCSSALFLCFFYWRAFREIKEVFMPSVTFISVAHAAIIAGLKIYFKDEIYVGEQYKIGPTNIIDSAHSLYRGCYVKNSLMCFSFYPTKLLGGAEGGMITTDNESEYNWFIKARNNGLTRKSMFDWDYEIVDFGFKFNMTNLQAAVLIPRLKKLDKFNKQREKIRDYYNLKFNLQNNSLHIYPMLVDNRDTVIKKLAKKGINCSVHFKPIHLQPVYKTDLILPNSEYWGEHELSIPLHENLKLKNAKKISDIIYANALQKIN